MTATTPLLQQALEALESAKFVLDAAIGMHLVKVPEDADGPVVQIPAAITAIRAHLEEPNGVPSDTVSRDGLLAWIERVGTVRMERVREGSRNGPIRWDVEFGWDEDEACAPTLAEAIRAAMHSSTPTVGGEG